MFYISLGAPYLSKAEFSPSALAAKNNIIHSTFWNTVNLVYVLMGSHKLKSQLALIWNSHFVARIFGASGKCI